MIAECAIVEAWHVQQGGKTVFQYAAHLVHAASHGAGGVQSVAYSLQEGEHLIALPVALRGHLVADAPHYYRGVVAEVAQHVLHVFLRPFIEEAVVSVLAFGDVPFVKRLHHHHESHLVA